MNTLIAAHIKKAISVIRDGGIVIFPTDTAFGIGCRIDSAEAVDRLFTIRRRPVSQATPVLVDSVDMARTYFKNPSDQVNKLMQMYWPGALTIVSACDTRTVYAPVRGDGPNIGLRMPDHKTVLSIISGIGIPVLGPSANFHGEPTPYIFEDLDPDLVQCVDYTVPGECTIKLASTVVDCSSTPYRIIRRGAIDLP